MSKIEKRRLVRCLGVITAVLIIVICFAAVVTKYKLKIVLCPVRALTGFNCPGCGNTRAMIALFHMKFLESLSYNYAYPVEFAYLSFVVFKACKNYVKQGKLSYYPKHPALDYLLLALMLIWGIARNFFGL